MKADFYYFKKSGKYYTEAMNHDITPLAFDPMLDAAGRRRTITRENGGKMPGLSGPGLDLICVVITDDEFGYPMLLGAPE